MAGSWHRILPGTLLLLGAVGAAQKRAQPQHRSTAVQRRVLEDGVAALREMLAGASGSSSGGSMPIVIGGSSAVLASPHGPSWNH